MTDLQEKRDLLVATSKNLTRALRDELSNVVESFGRQFDEERYAAIRSREIKTTSYFSSPLSIINAVNKATSDINALFKEKGEGLDNISNEPSIQAKSKDAKYLPEEGVVNLVLRHDLLLSRLITIRSEEDRNNKTSQPWDAKEATKRLKYFFKHLTHALNLQIFNADNATKIYKEKVVADEAIVSFRARLKVDLPARARLHMSTIGSSHRLLTTNGKGFSDDDDDDDDDDVADIFGRLTLRDNNSCIHKDTICIFDESGCIPAYELLGLSRLGRSINALILVGDKHQLPPYDPMQGMTYNRYKKNGSLGNERRDRIKILSLLDSSALTTDTGKVILDTQYRVPRDIAEMLNARVYNGQYKTCPTAKVPTSGLSSNACFFRLFHPLYLILVVLNRSPGLSMMNVPWAESPRRKYVNPNEIEMGMNLLRQFMRDYEISSTLVITPVSPEILRCL